MPSEARPEGAITVGELEDARLGFFQSLSRRFGREFKERHGDDLFAQALYEFSRKVHQGEEIRNPAAWITHCAWNRSKTEMEARTWRPQLVPTESLPTEPVAESSWQPEDHVLSEDRLRKLEDAVDQLPEHQRELLARHYFEGESVRAASRRMGWSEGKGAHTHNAARRRLREIFAGLRSSDLEAVGFLSFLSLAASGRDGVVDMPGGLEAALDRVAHAVSDGWHKAVDLARHPIGGGRAADLASAAPQSRGRLSQVGRRIVSSPVAETAVASDGPGRMIEVCKGLAVCAVSGVAVTAGVFGTGGGHHRPVLMATRPAPRHSQSRSVEDTAKATPNVPAAEGTEAETPPTEPRHQHIPRSEPASVAHSVSGSRATAERTTKELDPEADEAEVEVEEAPSHRETFGAFEGRGEGGSSEGQSSGAEMQSLSDATSSSSSTAEPAEQSPPPAPKEAAEKQAAGEMFGGALR